MSVAVLAALLGLALVDSTSFGTLVLPLMMLLSPRVRTRNVVVHLGVLAVFYLGVGVLLMLGAEAAVAVVGPLLESRVARAAQLALGVALVVLSFVLDPRMAAKRRARRGLPPRRPSAWRRRALGADATLPVVVGVALLAGAVEVASMLPYLGAVGLIVTAGVGRATQLAVLAGYVAVMVAPALVLLAVRRAGGRRLEPRLARLEAWLTTRTAGASAWVVGVIGVLVGLDAVGALLPDA
ncbi:Sap, sulfolipid-1-addressing protein [Friedmanniella luteola]|uniref:Sap, sulfolipid-1-addressing protein n=1 Tax=Friedmanniella luteola TaxID=546871 RepID=A0A1H1M849_9ACTN|nr:GAP family protein [Friedmanniella luteola]SDR82797.1 Sap, sulfolipid-1-addressing protein [Friedmanniella luteola]